MIHLSAVIAAKDICGGWSTAQGRLVGGRIAIAYVQKHVCFDHSSRRNPPCGFSRKRNSRIGRKIGDTFMMWRVTMCDVVIKPESLACELQ